jgi:threonine/homoserine/homoserine lactone efflux protein
VWDLFTAVLPLGLAAAVTPTLFALQVLVVSGPEGRTRSVAVIVGSGLVFAAVFALALGGLSALPDAGTGRTSVTEYWIECLAGLVLILLGVWMLRPHPEADAKLEEKVQGYASHASSGVFAGLAAYMTVTDFSSLVLLVPALHEVTRSTVWLAAKVVIVAFLFVCAMLPVLIPPIAVRLGGQRGVDALQRAYRLVMGHQVQVMGAIAVPLGAVLLWRGAQGLW